MFMEERHRAILDLLSQNQRISVGEIQQKFHVGYETAKRDLRILEESGLLKRTHGGAIPLRQVAAGKPPKVTERDMTEIRENYMAIAMHAISMLENNDVIYLPSATVGYFMAQKLPENLKLRVVTNSIVMAEELRKRDKVSVIMLGGEMDQKGHCYDAIAAGTIRRLRFDKCFLTSAALSADFGLSIQRTGAIDFWNALISSAKQVIGLYPTQKIGFDSVVSICPAEKLDVLITDWEAAEKDLKKFDEKGIQVVVVERQKEKVEKTQEMEE
ncbi:MAG: DeoR/GlpR family DNA-binding transcription regulator [Lachnospiraceae bacterium]|nr:DeoR/GlpR family DNA-binding transcription regulator [Lachnospiraceae bacterium]